MQEFPQLRNPSPLEEEENEEHNYTSPMKKRKTFLHQLKTIFFVFLSIAAIAVIIAAIVELAKNNQKSSDPDPLSEGINSRIIETLFNYRRTNECIDSLTIDPVLICEDECRKEFCKDEEDEFCRGNCYPLKDVTYEQCIAGCACCAGLTQCLFENGNDKDACYEGLSSQCSQKDDSVPKDEYFNPVCGPVVSLNECKRVGSNFPIPIKC